MSQKLSLPQSPQSVQHVLTGYKPDVSALAGSLTRLDIHWRLTNFELVGCY